MAARQRASLRLPPEVNRALYVRNLPFKITSEEMYDIFGKFGAIRQIRLGNASDTRGTAFVTYEDIFDAKNAVDHLSGFNVCGRYLVVLCATPRYSFPPNLLLVARALGASSWGQLMGGGGGPHIWPYGEHWHTSCLSLLFLLVPPPVTINRP